MDGVRERLGAAIEASSYSAASLGKAVGSKDYVRDFLKGTKNSLGAEERDIIENCLRLPRGYLSTFYSGSDERESSSEKLQPNEIIVDREELLKLLEGSYHSALVARDPDIPRTFARALAEGAVNYLLAPASERTSLSHKMREIAQTLAAIVPNELAEKAQEIHPRE